MRLLTSIYDRTPTYAFAIVLALIFVAAFLSDRADRARYRQEMCSHYQAHGWPEKICQK